jgi:hypothetical protein
MKFLCVSCDEAMKLLELAPPERGSLSVLYRCPTCSHEIAMLTNPYETQVVGSLGVEIGTESERASGESKCPFSNMMQDAEESRDDSISWSAEARLRLDNMPDFARPLAKAGIEKFAHEHGVEQIDVGVLDRAREFLGA